MAKKTTGDIAVYTVGSIDLLAVVKNVTYEVTNETVDGRPITRPGKSAQVVKRGGQISTSVMSTISTPTRVANIDVGAMTIDGTSFLASLRGGSFTMSYEIVESSGVADLWKFPEVVAKDFQAQVEFVLPTAAASDPAFKLMTDIHGVVADSEMVFSITINSVATTLPMLLKTVSVIGAENDLLKCSATLEGRSPDSGAYPTASTGTTSLLEKALNVPGTAMAFTFTPHSAEFAAFTGNLITSAASFSFNDAQLVSSDFTWQTQGAITMTGN